MKICFVNNLYEPYSVGGAETVVRERARDLARAGGDAVVITSGPWRGWGSWRPVRDMLHGVAVYRFWVPNICWYRDLSKHSVLFKTFWHMLDIWNYPSTRIVQSILQAEKPDTVETHNLMGTGFGIPRMVQKLKMKHVHYLHDVQLVEPSGVLPWNHTRDSFLQKVYSGVMRWRMGEPDQVFSPSKFLQDFYSKRGYFKKSSLSYERDSSTSSSVPLGRDFGRNDKNRMTFLFVGSLVEHKGIRVLLDAWKLLPKDLPATLHIVGDGALRREVELFAREDARVVCHGRLDQKALSDLYKQCGTLIFPSICIENHPTVIDEAHAHGLRVIASDTGGVSEIIHQANDMLLTPNDANLLSSAILKFSSRQVH